MIAELLSFLQPQKTTAIAVANKNNLESFVLFIMITAFKY